MLSVVYIFTVKKLPKTLWISLPIGGDVIMKNKHEKLIEKKWNLFMRTFRFLTVACGLIKISPTSVPHQMGL